MKTSKSLLFLEEYILKSYCGDHCPDTDGYYIQLETKESEKLGRQLFNGELGSLD